MNVSDSEDVHISKHAQLAVSIVIHSDLSWHALANGCKVPSNNPELSMKHQVIASVTDVQDIIDFLDSCTVCVGNDDAKYAALVTDRNGTFVDVSGTYTCSVLSACALAKNEICYYS